MRPSLRSWLSWRLAGVNPAIDHKKGAAISITVFATYLFRHLLLSTTPLRVLESLRPRNRISIITSSPPLRELTPSVTSLHLVLSTGTAPLVKSVSVYAPPPPKYITLTCAKTSPETRPALGPFSPPLFCDSPPACYRFEVAFFTYRFVIVDTPLSKRGTKGRRERKKKKKKHSHQPRLLRRSRFRGTPNPVQPGPAAAVAAHRSSCSSSPQAQPRPHLHPRFLQRFLWVTK